MATKKTTKKTETKTETANKAETMEKIISLRARKLEQRKKFN